MAEKMHVLDYPLSVVRDIKTAITKTTGTPSIAVETTPTEFLGAVLGVITPALGQFVVFFGTLLFFLVTSVRMRGSFLVIGAVGCLATPKSINPGRRAAKRFISAGDAHPRPVA